MKLILTATCVIAATFFAAAISAQGTAGNDLDGTVLSAGVQELPASIPGSSRYQLESAKVGTPYFIDVLRIDSAAVFAAPPPSDSPLPVIFVTDYQPAITRVPDIVRSLQLPSLYVVGIAWDEGNAGLSREGHAQRASRRTRDFLPVDDEAAVASWKQDMVNAGLPVPEVAEFGHADDFLAFIEEELKPFLSSRFRVNLADTTLIGHSAGGLFALHVLFTSPESFQRYIAISPPADYGKDFVFGEEASRGDLSARLFMGVGSNDLPNILESTPRLDAQIQAHARPSLEYSSQVFPGENHASVAPKGIEAGLRTVFTQ